SAAGTWSLTLPTSGGANKYALTTNGAGITSWSQIDLTAAVTGNLPVTNLSSGTGASSSTYWRGDGTWATPPGSGSGITTMTTGASDPVASCTAPSTSNLALYTQTTTQDLWACVATNTWKKVLATVNTGTYTETGLAGAAPSNPASGYVTCYFSSVSLTQICLDASGNAFSSVKTLSGRVANQFVTYINAAGVQQMAGLAAADVTAAWSGTCSSSTFLRGDGTCAATGGSGTVTASGTPLIHQLPIWTTATDVKGLAVGATDKPLVGVTGADPAFSKLTLTNPSTAATLTIADGGTLQQTGAYTLNLTATAASTPTFPAGTRTLMATDTALSLSQLANQGTTTTVLHGNAAGNPAFGAVVSADIADGTIAVADLAAILKTRSFTVVFTGSGTGGLLDNADDQPALWYNSLGQGVTLTGVSCKTDSATASRIQLQRDDGSPANILTDNAGAGLDCSSTRGSGTLSGTEKLIASTNGIDFVMVSAGGVAKWVSLTITYTLD
ncbi:MAG: hypothetical protein NTW28_16590, partial [Candidatus Solibacter sp.]|nr:hypothetical protein [Candidatus Solibacter sp.]